MCRYVQADRQESLCLDSKLIYLPLDSGTLVFAYVPRNQFTRRNHWKRSILYSVAEFPRVKYYFTPPPSATTPSLLWLFTLRTLR